MKKFLSGLLIATAVVGIVNINGLKVVAETVERGFVSVSASANKELQPDVVDLRIEVRTDDDKSLQKATDENKEISEKLYNELSAMINKDNGDYIKTTNFKANPVYSYKNNKRTITKYEVSNTVVVHTKSIQDAGKIIDKAILFGATNVSDVKFSVSSYEKQCDDLLNQASKKAYKTATSLVAGSNGVLNGIKSLNGSCSTSEGARVQYKAMVQNLSLDSATATPEQTPIESGVIKLFAHVNASYFVK